MFETFLPQPQINESANFSGVGGINKKPDKDVWDSGIGDKATLFCFGSLALY